MSNDSATILERSSVPAIFPFFRNAASLAHLAHCKKGPRYAVIGGKAWYEVADIKAWLESKKTAGPVVEREHQPMTVKSAQTKRRGRPTKMEQYYRSVKSGLESAAD